MPATNEFSSCARTLSDPASDAIPVTPTDSSDLTRMTKALWLPLSATGGIVRVITEAGNTRDLPLYPGDLLPIRVTRILATGTTASGVWAFV